MEEACVSPWSARSQRIPAWCVGEDKKTLRRFRHLPARFSRRVSLSVGWILRVMIALERSACVFEVSWSIEGGTYSSAGVEAALRRPSVSKPILCPRATFALPGRFDWLTGDSRNGLYKN